MSQAVLAIRSVLPRLIKPLLLLTVAAGVVAAVFLFELTAQRAREAADRAAAAPPPATQLATPPAATQPAARPAPAAPSHAATLPAAPAPAPQPRPQAPATPTQPAAGHQVAAGETLAAIAVRYDVPAEQLAADNALANPNHIRAGQQLRIGPKAAGSHVIRPGETLSGVASRHGLSLAQLRALNPQVTNPDLILAGHRLALRQP